MVTAAMAAPLVLGGLLAVGVGFGCGWLAGRRSRRPAANLQASTNGGAAPATGLPVASAGRSPADTDRAGPASASPGADRRRPARSPDFPGAAGRTTLGRYVIERELGRGSMGTVYLGRDPQIGRLLALKTLALSREFDGTELAEARTRFFREAEVAGRLRHPDIVTVHDAGEDADLAFIAMEYVAGHDLSRHVLAGQRLPVPAVLQTLARVALALAHAHAQGIVHRDMKPANVLLDPANDVVKVTDFGIAHLADACRTRTGLVLGTPSFMSPEQMTGRRIDGRSDLYALGVMLYQLLTGELPHQSESMAELLRSIVNDPAPDLRARRPELPESLANVVALALEKRVEVRYADGRQLADDLQAVATQIERG